ncbi:hypothetical protein I3700191H1_08560 [Megasphaera massiliensis]
MPDDDEGDSLRISKSREYSHTTARNAKPAKRKYLITVTM